MHHARHLHVGAQRDWQSGVMEAVMPGPIHWEVCSLQVLRAPVPAKPLKMQANLPVTPDCLEHPPAAFPVILRMISAPCCGSCRACISTFLHSNGCHMLGAGCLPALGVMRLCPPTDCAAQGLRAPCPPVADGVERPHCSCVNRLQAEWAQDRCLTTWTLSHSHWQGLARS